MIPGSIHSRKGGNAMRNTLLKSVGLFLLLTTAMRADDRPALIAMGAKLEKLWSEGEFTEGPAYGPDHCVVFSDIGNRIMKFDPATGKTTEFRKPSGRSNGLDFDPEGRLV